MKYADAGVSIDNGEKLVEAIKPLVKTTHRRGVMGTIGGFGALFDLKAAGFIDPILVSTTDGVGTKLKLAVASNQHGTIGIDLVAMCVNDLVVQGATPLFFLDYYATGRLTVDQGREIIAGIAEGCRQAGCALVGGETAEMPGMYTGGDYDLAGFSVGAVERGRLLPNGVSVGDVVLGLASSGLHSNGYSLVRKLGITRDDLLTPTRVYVSSCLAACATGGLKALAHITGGGIIGNVPRVMPTGLGCDLCLPPLPPVFESILTAGVEPDEMLRTFNCGIGMVAVVDPARVGPIAKAFESGGETVFEIGRVVEGQTTVARLPRVESF